MKTSTKLLSATSAVAALLAFGFGPSIADACDKCAKHNPSTESADEAHEHGDDHEHLDAEEGFVTLLDANHMDGWTLVEDWMRIDEDGVLIAGSMDKAIPKTMYAAHNQEYYNFELRLQLKYEGPANTNGGVQIRSTFNPENGEMAGYQADMGAVYWGRLYDQGRRNRLLTEHPAGFELEEVIKRDDWNDYVIRCEGPRIRVWINGTLTADYTESDEEIATQPGVIGLQMHRNDPSLRYYRNIRIKELD